MECINRILQIELTEQINEGVKCSLDLMMLNKR